MTIEQKLSNYMANQLDEFYELLQKVVQLESPTEGGREDLKICRDFFSTLFEKLGFRSEVIKNEDKRFGDHLHLTLGEGEEQLLFVGHYDTVYEKGSFGSLWKSDENKIWGPGVLDMKGGNIQVYFVVKALQDLELLPDNKKIVFLLSADEEAGSPTSHELFKKEAKKSKAAFVMEPTMGDCTGGLTIGRFSRGNYTFIAEGQSAHSGQHPEKAESALKELAQQAQYLESLTDLEKGITIACTCLTSGNAGWPTVPGEGELTIDARFFNDELAEKFDAQFQKLTPFNPHINITTQGGIEKPSFEPDQPGNKKLFKIAQEMGRKFDMEMEGYIGRAGTDGNFTSSAGCPTLDGMGMSGNYLHQPGKEYMNVDDVIPRGAFVARMVIEVFQNM